MRTLTLLIALAALTLLGSAHPPAARSAPLEPQVYLVLLERPGSAVQNAAQRQNAEEVVRLVNVERAAVGCAPLSINADLVEAAQLHSVDMAEHNFMSHTGSDGSNFSQRARAAGYTGFPGGENVAAGYPTPAAVMRGWMESDGHRKNILNCNFRNIGVGYASNPNSTYIHYWTQVFGR